jgi:hypothetical protein
MARGCDGLMEKPAAFPQPLENAEKRVFHKKKGGYYGQVRRCQGRSYGLSMMR